MGPLQGSLLYIGQSARLTHSLSNRYIRTSETMGAGKRVARRGPMTMSRALKGALMGIAAARRTRMSQSHTKTMTRSSRSGSAPLTGQFDYKTDYSKRRYGRKMRRVLRRRRKWRGKVVRTVRNADVGTTHIIRRSFGTIITGNNLSERVTYGLNGLNGRLFNDFNSTDDLAAILKDVDPASWNAADSLSIPGQNHKLYVKHGTMELVVRNTGENDALLEFYYHRGARPTRREISPSEVYDQGFIKQAVASDPNTGNTIGGIQLSSALVGTTPFQSHLFCQHYRIYRRQKFRLPPGNEINVVIHTPRPFTTNLDWLKNHSTDRNWHGILIQQQGVPNETLFCQPSQITYHSIRRYNFKMFRDNLPKDAFDPIAPPYIVTGKQIGRAHV